jgi:hypothetical protein
MNWLIAEKGKSSMLKKILLFVRQILFLTAGNQV